MYNREREMTYKEYLRDCSIYDQTELSTYKMKEVELPQNLKEELC